MRHPSEPAAVKPPRTSTSSRAISPRRILVIVTRQIGDVLLTTPLIGEARRLWPEARIEVLGFAGTLAMLEGNADVAACLTIASKRSFGQSFALIRRLWRRYELALVAEASDRAHVLGFVASAVRSGLVPERRAHAWWKRLLLRHAVTVSGDRGARHVAAEKLALLEPWQSGVAQLRVAPPPPHALPAYLERALGTRPIVVHAPSMWRYKQWPIAHFRSVVEALLREGHQIVLTGGDAPADREKVAQLAVLGAPPQLLDACGRLDFNQLSGLLGRAALYIGPDTSVTHLAAATGVPVVALFGPTNPMRWGPIGAQPDESGFVSRAEERQHRGKVVLLQGPGSCVPCGRAGCADHRGSASTCLESISPARVLAEAARVLEDAARTLAAPTALASPAS